MVAGLFFLTLVTIICFSCFLLVKPSYPNDDFFSLEDEQTFWNDWMAEKHNKCLGPFLGKMKPPPLQKENQKLREISKSSDIFVLVVLSNGGDSWGLNRIFSISKNKSWQATEWSDSATAIGIIEKPLGQIDVPEGILDRLSCNSVYVDTDSYNDWMDASNVFIFLNYHGKCSRFAIYEPFVIEPDVERCVNPTTKDLEQFLACIVKFNKHPSKSEIKELLEEKRHH
jgi:hypothetical protein